MTNVTDRESVPEPPNPIGMDGIEFIEFTTSRPQALGGVLERMGFRPVARHRSREVEVYRQGSMNIIINSQATDIPRTVEPVERPIISALAIRVRDADAAYRKALDLGAWEIPIRARALELNIPGIHGVGESLIYFVDRYDEFSIYDIDFVAIPTVDQAPPALEGMGYFGVVQYIGADRSADWLAYYEEMFDFQSIPDEQRFGILPKGKLMRSPCGKFLWQVIEPDPWMESDGAAESLLRVGLGVPDVPAAVARLKANGVDFIESAQLHPEDRGALTRNLLGSVSFELVHQAG